MVIPVKSISELEEKSEVSVSDKILILDSVSEEARLASKSELKGDPGTPGTPGKDGKDGEDGAAATITVGSVSTLPAGSSATVTNSGTTSAAVLNFGIPEGATGTPGVDGEDGAAATITVGTTTTLPAGSSATVTNVGTSQDAILNFGIPKGDSGSGSGDVNGPASSTDGDVVIFDGSTGKLIKDGSVALSTLSAGASAGATAIQPGDNISDLNNDAGYTTNTGDVVGPGSSTDGHLAVFDGATGRLLKDGGAMPSIPSITTISVTLTAIGWVSSTQTVSATGVTASNTVIIAPAPSDIEDYTDAKIYCSAQGTDSLTFTCDTTPSNDIDVNVVILG